MRKPPEDVIAEATHCKCYCGCNYAILSHRSMVEMRCFSCRKDVHAGRKDEDEQPVPTLR